MHSGREDRLTILAIGAATNIAILLLKYLELEDRIDEIVLVAGRRSMDQHFISGHWQAKPFALEVSNCKEAFEFLRKEEGIVMINRSEDYYPVKLEGFPITFFYWVDKYGIQWEMEEGRRIGISRGIA